MALALTKVVALWAVVVLLPVMTLLVLGVVLILYGPLLVRLLLLDEWHHGLLLLVGNQTCNAKVWGSVCFNDLLLLKPLLLELLLW